MSDGDVSECVRNDDVSCWVSNGDIGRCGLGKGEIIYKSRGTPPGSPTEKTCRCVVPSGSNMNALASPNKVLVTDLASVVKSVPSNFIRPISDRPNLTPVLRASSIPLIDLQGLDGPHHSSLVQHIGEACKSDGFFLVKNHGIPENVVNNMLRVAREFFRLPESERLKDYSDDPSKAIRLSTSFNIKTEKVANWRDFLRLHCYPLEDYVNEWPAFPPDFRKEVAEYCTRVRRLALRLLEAISESLGLDSGYINKSVGEHGQHMALNYYPPCPEPDLTYGLPGHTDHNLITILLQDDVPGLQILRNGQWTAINPIPNTFIVNIGDQMQVLSNDRYKSVIHRAVVNCSKERISIPTFYCPAPQSLIAPAPELVDHPHKPALYTKFTYNEYYREFWNRGLTTNNCLDLFRLAPT
ncbi:Isopenicillin N synthase-like, Fe(2+) 2OG dioxygenase domain [Dillenia turbinata]|uniref:Isopenicillin N synthase-like, Fe(2+) 2OG dioxygenase domain n=1 Tax=Dillenia turbinata TaxID=194707 RepID=A0AAN8ZNA3_9MAGN